jgi:hypothetical protein
MYTINEVDIGIVWLLNKFYIHVYNKWYRVYCDYWISFIYMYIINEIDIGYCGYWISFIYLYIINEIDIGYIVAIE